MMRHYVPANVSSLPMIVLVENVLGGWILVEMVPTVGSLVLRCVHCLHPISSSSASSGTLTVNAMWDAARMGIRAGSCPTASVVEYHCCWVASNGETKDWLRGSALIVLFELVAVDASNAVTAVLKPGEVVAVARLC